MRTKGLVTELWAFLRIRKKWWLVPIIVTMVLVGALLLVAVGQWYLVDHEVRTAAIGERQHRDPERGVVLIVGCDVDVQAAGIEFDYPVEQSLTPVRSDFELGLKKRPVLFLVLTNTRASD